jgi:hypothetical protein
MIQLQIDPKVINAAEAVIKSKISEAEEIISPASLSEIGKAIFTITAKRFLQDLAQTAIQNPHQYHHLYEWGRVGNTSQKLFLIKRTNIRYGNLSVTFVPLQSKTPVPINSALLTPGKTGKVVNSIHIFRDKMRIMEENIKVHYETKRTIVFNEFDEGLVFVPKNHIVNIMDPGGKETTGSLKQYSTYWYSTEASKVVSQSNLIKQIGNEVVKTINSNNSSKTKVRDTIRKVVSSYSKEMVEI